MNNDKTVFEGKFLKLKVKDNWEYVSRGCEIVMVAPLIGEYFTPMSDKQIVMVDQFRIPVGRRVLAFPAGLVDEGESPLCAMNRELHEETGLVADRSMFVDEIPSSSGLTDETVKAYLAFDCVQDLTWQSDPKEPMIVHTWNYKDLHKEIFMWKQHNPGGLVCAKAYYILHRLEELYPR
jgi:ADP-ribose pyrophosphatase